MLVRIETGADREAVRALNLSAFGGPEEADVVDRLREARDPTLFLVAEEDDAVVGHICFSRISLDGHPKLLLMALGPMAVEPARQRSGIGGRLVLEGLERCRGLGALAVIVLGHPTYYPRFGFAPASRLGLQCEFEVPDDVFMALELVPGSLAGKSGTLRYDAAFQPGWASP